MIWQYGNYKFNCNLQPPTVDKFKKWKDKFFKLENVDKYNVWLCGGFIEDWNTKDIDIVLNNKPEYGELKDIMLSAIKIGVDNNIFVDICHLNIEPLNYTETKKEVEVIKTVVGNKILQDQFDALGISQSNLEEADEGVEFFQKIGGIMPLKGGSLM